MSDALDFQILVRLRQDPGAFSRNKNFYAYEAPEARRAQRIARHLRALEADLLRAGGARVRVAPADGGRARRVIVHLPHIGATRIAYLSAAEFELLRQEPATRAVLDESA